MTFKVICQLANRRLTRSICVWYFDPSAFVKSSSICPNPSFASGLKNRRFSDQRFFGTRVAQKAWHQTTQKGTVITCMEPIAWLRSLCCYLRRSQSKTLSAPAMAALSVARVSLVEIGRHLPGLTKHDIRPLGRLAGNHHVRFSQAMKGLCRKLQDVDYRNNT